MIFFNDVINIGILYTNIVYITMKNVINIYTCVLLYTIYITLHMCYIVMTYVVMCVSIDIQYS